MLTERKPEKAADTCPGAKTTGAEYDNGSELTAKSSVLEFEDVVLHKMEDLLAKIERKMASWEAYGAAAVDHQIDSALQILSQLEQNVVKQQRERAEAFLKVVEKHCQDVIKTKESVAQKAAAGLKFFEDMVLKIEDSYAAHSVQTALERARSNGLLSIDELPDGWKDNPYIINGYRFCRNHTECISSVGRLHNETANIWTHVVGFIVLLGLAFYEMPSTDTWQALTWVDRIPVVVFIIAALKCLFCSVTWHTFCNIAHLHIKQRMSCVDYTGITVLIAASIVTTIHASLYCHPVARTFYTILTSLFGVGGVLFTWTPSFDSPEARHTRVIFFVSFALSGVVAGLHAMIYRAASEVVVFYLPVVKSLLCYAVGIVFYAFLIPERWMQGTIVDYIGMSHNLWHLCVFGGIYYHYKATLLLFEEAKSFVCA
ncbi:Uncharacterized protein C30D11.11 [Wickerhamiella sorbophila]|uniref:Uncharacterized protein C30D11.11 n=1 Tax=Wickerhamiella sorbophila TaxID=45607 RepID=A0A2T0FM55_9ASCO|nr:Uncharacterized protein C30D11.11 [Wickerhamiella sorbophila]PRT56059.1 Uncharacterized protein C30D11.11 [Wickerhamiella sorbophila]